MSQSGSIETEPVFKALNMKTRANMIVADANAATQAYFDVKLTPPGRDTDLGSCNAKISIADSAPPL